MKEEKCIVFVRHAKSSWDHLGIPDKQRPLNKRGMRDAPLMAAYLKEKLGSVDEIIASSAMRTRSTAQFFANELLSNPESIQFTEQLYACTVEDYIENIQALQDDCKTVLFVGHNPTITELAFQIKGQLLEQIPTCGVVIAKTSLSKWADFSFDMTSLVAIYAPKTI